MLAQTYNASVVLKVVERIVVAVRPHTTIGVPERFSIELRHRRNSIQDLFQPVTSRVGDPTIHHILNQAPIDVGINIAPVGRKAIIGLLLKYFFQRLHVHSPRNQFLIVLNIEPADGVPSIARKMTNLVG